jgi:hypothetical protein
MTDADRHRLGSAAVGKRLTERHVCIAHTLASWPRAYGAPSHRNLACATGTGVRTVSRAVLELRRLGLLSEGKQNLLRIPLPTQVRGFNRAMEAIATHFDCGIKTLYRWEGDARRSGSYDPPKSGSSRKR